MSGYIDLIVSESDSIKSVPVAFSSSITSGPKCHQEYPAPLNQIEIVTVYC